MKPMPPKKIAWWVKKKAKGKSEYIYRTALFWGGWMIIFTTLYELIFGNFHLVKLIVSLLLYFPGGALLGLLTWNEHERRYKYTVENNHISTN